ncbi:MAG: glutaredoxin family protein [Gemmataceae bacterium]
MLGWLWGESARGVEVVMYTRAGCHLCEEAWAVLEAERGRFGFTLRRADVDADTLLAERFGQDVPVVTVGGAVRFRGRVNPALLRRALRGGVTPSGASAPPTTG